MTTDTPSSRDEEIPTPRTDAFADRVIPVKEGQAQYTTVLAEWHNFAEGLEREIVRLSAEREDLITRQKIASDLLEYDRKEIFLMKDTLAERDKELAEVKASFESVSNIANARGRKIGELETICLQKDNQVDSLRAQLLAAQTVIIRLEGALGAIERSHHCDGDGCEVCNFLMDAPSSPDPTLLDEVVKVLEMAYNRALDWDMLGRAHGNSAVQMWRENAIRLLSRLRQSTRETEREGL